MLCHYTFECCKRLALNINSIVFGAKKKSGITNSIKTIETSKSVVEWNHGGQKQVKTAMKIKERMKENDSRELIDTHEERKHLAAHCDPVKYIGHDNSTSQSHWFLHFFPCSVFVL